MAFTAAVIAEMRFGVRLPAANPLASLSVAGDYLRSPAETLVGSRAFLVAADSPGPPLRRPFPAAAIPERP